LAAHLGRYRGASRLHTESDLHVYLRWCAELDIRPLAARRADVELYVRWLQDVRRFKPSTVSRRLSVIVGFYRTCVIDAILDHSPVEYVRRLSSNPYDFALVAMLGLLGLRIFEACAVSVGDLGEEHGHRVLRVCGKGSKVVLIPLPPAVGRAIDRAVGERAGGPILLNRRGVRMDRHAATRRLNHLAAAAGVRMPRMHPHMLRHTYVTTMLDAGVPLRDVQIAARHADPRTTMRYDRARKNLDRIPTTSSPPSWPPAPETAPAEISAFSQCARRTNPSDAVASVNDLASSIYRCQTVGSWIRWQ
jgi:integrase/recombinase XerD